MESTHAAGEVRPADDRGTIAVTVTLFADLRRFLPPGVDGPHRRTVAAGARVADLLAAMGIPQDYDLTVGIDGEMASRDDALHDGAEIMLLSPMEGGSIRRGPRRPPPGVPQEPTAPALPAQDRWTRQAE